jgi:RNA polymerase sigma factor (sigma-70 family)
MTVRNDACSRGFVLTPDYPRAKATASVADLLTLISQRESSAWEEIIHRYGSVVFAAVRSFRLQDADVLDAVQMTWVRLAENAHRIQYPERLGGWLATTARREALHILRQHAKHTLIPAETVAENVTDPAAGPEQRVIHRETQRILRNLVAELSPLRRSLLRALFSDNPRCYNEAARTVGIPLGGIGPTRARALQQLRRRIDELGVEPGITP